MHAITRAELFALAETTPCTDLTTAGRCFGMGRTKSFELARRGEFPVPVLKIGNSYRVPTQAILDALGVRPTGEQPGLTPNSAEREGADLYDGTA